MRASLIRRTALGFTGLACLGVALSVWAGTARVKDVRLWSGPEGTRLVVETTTPVEYDVFALDGPDRVVIDLANTNLAGLALPAGQGPVRSVRSGTQPGHGLRLVLDLDSPRTANSFVVGPDGGSGHRLVVELPGKSGVVADAAAAMRATAVATGAAPPAPGTPPPAAIQRPAIATTAPTAPTGGEVLVAAASTTATAGSAARAATPGLPKINEPTTPAVKSVASAAKGRELVIAIDAGHGGQDPGAIGRGGTREKDVTLAIARKLAAAINAEEGMRAVLTRDGDYFITLGGRTRKARQLNADMFVSVHADSVLNREVSGSSVYVLSLRGASDEAARWLAESENAADLKGGVPLVEDDVLASVLLDVTQKQAISNSVEAADDVLATLRTVGAVHRPRVQHAGFVVLKSPDIPSMLVETAFISNAADERRLRDASHQQRIAEAIRTGVRNYWHENPPPGTRLAALAAERRARANTTVAER
jgi:N-acetylmuramoyl-L-alanine amidase